MCALVLLLLLPIFLRAMENPAENRLVLEHEVRAYSLALIPYCLTVEPREDFEPIRNSADQTALPFIFTQEGLAIEVSESDEPIALEPEVLLGQNYEIVQKIYERFVGTIAVKQVVQIAPEPLSSWEWIYCGGERVINFIAGIEPEYASVIERNIKDDKLLYVSGTLSLPSVEAELTGKYLENLRNILSAIFALPYTKLDPLFSIENYKKLRSLLQQVRTVQPDVEPEVIEGMFGDYVFFEKLSCLQRSLQDTGERRRFHDERFKCVVECVSKNEKENTLQIRSTCAADYPSGYQLFYIRYSSDDGRKDYELLLKDSLSEGIAVFPYTKILLKRFLKHFLIERKRNSDLSK